MKKAILRGSLYIPVNNVDPFILDSFTYTIEDSACAKCKEKNSESDACLDCPLSNAREIITYKRDKGLYAFCRGNLGKIYRLFSDFNIIDETTDAPMMYGLKFTSKLWDNQVKTTNEWLKHKYGVIQSPPRSGKAQPLYSLIRTPEGWIQMGDIKTGDMVSTPDGRSALVTRVFPQGLRPIYRINFEDGRFTDCDEDHLWKVFNRRYQHNKYWRILSLKEIIDLKQRSKIELFVPLPEPIENSFKDLPLNPYVLGLLLGDGSFQNRLGFNNIDFEIIQEPDNNVDYTIIFDGKPVQSGKKSTYTSTYIKVLADLGLWGKHSREKFIPKIYLEASIDQRLELLRGLMDADGSVGETNGANLEYNDARARSTPRFSSFSSQLSQDVQYIVRSLGGLCKLSIRDAFYAHQKVKKQGKDKHICSIRYKFSEKLYKLSRKKRVRRLKDIALRCKIKAVEYLGMQETQCIAIDDPNHLYITDNFIVTHNTLMACYLTCFLHQKTLILTHQSDLLDQFKTTFENHTNLKDLQDTSPVVGLTNCRDDISQYDVCLTTYQSFLSEQGVKYLDKIKNSFGLVIVDECFPKDTEILVDYDKYMTIEEIVENPNITHVLSYDLEKGEIVKKRILNRFKSTNTEGWVTLQYENGMILQSTPNHNIYTGEWVKVQAKNMKGRTCITYTTLERKSLIDVHNHTIRVDDVHLPTKIKGGTTAYKYNIEVEDYHNYFVLAKEKLTNERCNTKKRIPILVSNCHLSAAHCFRRVINRINSKYRIGLSATPERKDGLECLASDIIGPVTAVGRSNEMHCVVEEHYTGFKIQPFKQWTTFIRRLCDSKMRNEFICEQVIKDVQNGRYVLLVTERKSHIDFLVKTLQEKGLNVAAFDGRMPKKIRPKFLEEVREGKIDVLVAMRKMIKLGIDLPIMDSYFHVVPTAYDNNYYQEMSRVRTLYPKELEKKLGHTKPTPIIRIFLDFGHGATYACQKVVRRVHKAHGFTIRKHTKPEFKNTKKKGW